jgi:hypothetical protein
MFGLEPNGNVVLHLDNEVAEISIKDWYKIIKFIQREESEREEERRMEGSFFKRMISI